MTSSCCMQCLDTPCSCDVGDHPFMLPAGFKVQEVKTLIVAHLTLGLKSFTIRQSDAGFETMYIFADTNGLQSGIQDSKTFKTLYGAVEQMVHCMGLGTTHAEVKHFYSLVRVGARDVLVGVEK